MIAKEIGAKDREEKATRKTPTAGKRAKIPDGTRRAMYEDWRRGWTLKHVAEYYGYAMSTTTRIIREEKENMKAKEKAPAAVEEPTSAVAENQDEYTTLDAISKEMTEKQARIEIVNICIKAVLELLNVKSSSALFDYKLQEDGQYDYEMRYPVDTIGILVEICNAIKGVAE